MTSALFDYLPVERILEAFSKAPGNEIESEKLSSPESSAALAANTFGLFLDRPHDLPPIPGVENCSWPAICVAIERCVRFPWSGGRHPWLDAYVETPTNLIGIESKRYEPFREKQLGSFSKAYWRPVWGDRMKPFERMRDRIAAGEARFEHLDPVQLVKHAFGLRTEAQRRKKPATLVYLYAEPRTWPDGQSVDPAAIASHASEARAFASDVHGAEVAFVACTYGTILDALRASPLADVQAHAIRIESSFFDMIPEMPPHPG